MKQQKQQSAPAPQPATVRDPVTGKLVTQIDAPAETAPQANEAPGEDQSPSEN